MAWGRSRLANVATRMIYWSWSGGRNGTWLFWISTMPGSSGTETLKQLKAECPKLPVLVLSMHPEDQYAVRMFKAGADGYLTKGSAPEELVEAIKKVLGGGQYVSPSLAEKLALTFKASDGSRPS